MKIRNLLFIIILFFIASCGKKQENLENSKQVVMLIYGHPACGKYTIAKAVANKYNLYLLDHHLFTDIFTPFKQKMFDSFEYVDKTRELVMDFIIKKGKKDKGFVFTNVNVERSKRFFKEIKKFSNKLNYIFLPIQLVCNEDEIKDRMNNRKNTERIKITNYNDFKKRTKKLKLINIKDSLIIENKNLDKTLSIISDKLEIIPNIKNGQ